MIGWIGVFLGLFVAPVQLARILRTGQTAAISKWTYRFLCGAVACYLIHAIMIDDTVFIVANSINLLVNMTVLILLETKGGGKNGK